MTPDFFKKENLKQSDMGHYHFEKYPVAQAHIRTSTADVHPLLFLALF